MHIVNSEDLDLFSNPTNGVVPNASAVEVPGVYWIAEGVFEIVG
jgi:hypothetical protein